MIFKKQLSSEILINSSAKRVWELITNFEDFPRWNPFIRKASGEIKIGARLEVLIQPSGTKGRIFRPRVLKVEPTRELRWLGQLYLPRLFDGEHALIIEPVSKDSVKFIQREKFIGLLIPFSGKPLRDTQRGFEEMNTALKKQAESAKKDEKRQEKARKYVQPSPIVYLLQSRPCLAGGAQRALCRSLINLQLLALI